MDNKLNNAMNEIDEVLIEEAAHADRAERRGLVIVRNVGISLCGGAAAAAAITFGINLHLASLPQNVDLLPAESNEANSNISEVIAEMSLQTLTVERVDAADVDPLRLSASAPYFIEARPFVIVDSDGNELSRDNTILFMDCGGYWVQYDVTSDDGVIDELLDIRGALEKAENVLGASLTDVKIEEYNTFYMVTAQFDNGSCLNYSLDFAADDGSCTMYLLDENVDPMKVEYYPYFFHEEKAGVYDSVRFCDRSGVYICDNNGEIRVVKYNSEGYFGYLPFGGREEIYTIENTETGSRQKYCVKENGDAITTTEDFLNVIGGTEHQDDPQNIILPLHRNITDDTPSAPLPEIGAVSRYDLSYAPDYGGPYDGPALSFLCDRDGRVFLYDFNRLYPCTMQKTEDILYRVSVNFYPEGREKPDGFFRDITMNILVNGDILTLDNDCELCIDEQGETKMITLYKGTEFSMEKGGSLPENSDIRDTDGLSADKANLFIMEKIRAAQAENTYQTPYTGEFVCVVDDEFCNITTSFGYDEWRGGTYYGIDIGCQGIAGANIYAAQSGTVIISDYDDYYGKYAVIDHGNGLSTLYAHCEDITVTEGQTVSQGDIIGHVGATGGFFTGECLHFSVRVNGVAVDPMNYMRIPNVYTVPPTNYIEEAGDEQAVSSDMTAEEQRELNEHWAELIASVPDPNFLCPLDGGTIVEHMYGHYPDSGYYRHMGIDIIADYGDPIFAAADGEVILAQWYYSYGNCVMIQHDNGVVTVYGHCSELYASEGDVVTRGQVIAAAGATGQATSTHLHFEVRINDECVDPTLFNYE